MSQALSFRQKLIAADGCSFNTTITADYQDVCYTFAMKCKVDSSGNLKFEVLEPESIRGITGSISAGEGKLTFDDQVLLFATLLEGQITPVSAPWLLINTLRNGYIKGCSMDDDGYTVQINDSYAEDAIQLNIKIVDGLPVFGEIIWKNRRVMTLNVECFTFL